MIKHIIVGTGLSSLAAVLALISKNIKPTVLDIGLNNIKSKKVLKSDYSKLPYLQEFNYLFESFSDNSIRNNTELLKSVGYGGLSNVWGGSICKIHKKDFKNWPIKFDELNKYYKKLDKHFMFDGFDDLYSEQFNLKKTNRNLPSYLENEKELLKEGIFFGNPRNILGKSKKILNSKYYINELIKSNKINYINNIKVKNYIEKKNFVQINCQNIKSKKQIIIKCKKLLLGCGTFQTAKIIFNSENINSLKIKESKLIPSVWFMKDEIKKKHKLSFLFNITHLTKFKFHSQVYKIDLDLLKKLESNFPVLKLLPGILKKFMMNNFLIIFTYIDQKNSNQLILKKKDGNTFIKKNNYKILDTYAKIKRLITKIFSNRIINIFSVTSFRFGYGYHFGSSLPMSNKIKNNKSDKLGRPFAKKRVHIIDSSILPEIPVNTISYTVMANAYRIADKI